MRVIAGSAKGRTLLSVPGDTTRPILDRVKVALFDILRPSLPETHWLDLFAGSGGVGIEALSQGAARCVFLDLAAPAVTTIRKNLEATRLASQAEVRQTDGFSYLRSARATFDVIYVAPPQFETLWIQALQTIAERPQIVKPGGMIIVQIDPKEYEAVALRSFAEERKTKYGNTLLVFYRKQP